MPSITNGKELLTALGPVVDAANPITDLKARGYTLAPALSRVLDTPAAELLFASPERQRLLAERRGRRTPELQAGPLTRIAALLPGGHHDLTVGLRLEKANEILANAFETRSIPRDVAVRGRVSDPSLASLLSVLRSELVGVPAGDDIRIGTLHIFAAPTVSALPTPPPRPNQPVDSTARLLVHLPIVLDIDRDPADGVFESAIATLRAVAEFGIAVSARVDGSELAITAGAVPGQIGAADPERMRIKIGADSPLQPVDADSGDTIGLAIEVGGFQKVLRDVAISTTIAPRVRLPLGSGLNVFVRHVDLRAVQSGGVGHLMVGLEIGGEPSPVPLTGQPELLERNPFEAAGASVYIEVHAELFRVLVKQAFLSGELQRFAKERRSNVRLKSADAELGANTIGLFLEGKLVDECGLFGQNFKDVGFDGFTRVELRSVDAGHLRFEEVESLGILDADIADIVACALLKALELHLLGIGKGGLEFVFSFLSDFLFGTTPATAAVVNLFARNVPIPTTELLPQLRALAASIDPTAMRIQAALDLVPDTVNTYVYVRCEFRLLPQGGPGMPVRDAQVRLLDQDVPAPAGDDAPVPTVGTTVTPVGPRQQRIVEVTFAPSPADQELASGITDRQGRVLLVVPPGRIATSAGVTTTVSITEDIASGEIIKSDITRRVVKEARPDVYFVIDVPGGGRLDTRAVAGGFVRNLESRHWGTADQPLVFNVPIPTGPTNPF